jgi:23S rRNA pseudouridine2605 synthase
MSTRRNFDGNSDKRKKTNDERSSSGKSNFKSNDRNSKPYSKSDKPYAAKDKKFDRDGDKKSSSPRPYKNDKPAFGEKNERTARKTSFSDKPYEKKSYSDNDDRPARKSFGDKDKKESFGGERKSYSDKPFEKKPFSERNRKDGYKGDKNSYPGKPYDRKPTFGDKDDRPVRKSFGDKDKKESFGGERKSYSDKPFEKKPFSERNRKDGYKGDKNSYPGKPYDNKPTFGDKDDRPVRKTFADRDKKEGFGGEKRPYSDKPYEKKPYSDRGEKSERKPYGDRAKKEGFTSEHTGRKDGPYKDFRNGRPKNENSENDLNKSERDGIRLNRYISNSGICSRREADELIKTGVVTVNNEVITEMGYKVKPGDIVHYGGDKLSSEKPVYLVLNKPKNHITTTNDPSNRKTVMHLIEGACKERVYPVGRLDRNTLGVLLFTNDGDLAKKLLHPKHNVKKIYHVSLDKAVKMGDLTKLMDGIELEDGIAKADLASYIEGGKSKKEIGLEIHTGKNRIVRRMFESLGYEVVKLDRVYFAGLTKKNLARGQWRFLDKKEIDMLHII